jgi:D-alanyl-lipoteichoic acid acyltransferase DltB (MBOAT superfamily)
MFYPQLVAGPIERPQNILHQFHEEKKYKYENVRDGLLQMLWGFFKKIVVADNISGMVNLAYTHPEQQTGLTLLLATYLFAIQIYCDFSGYSDIAIGAAKTMGFDLMENFKTPYISKNIKEFWSRWHISLSTWFKDYLYIPIGGNRVRISRMMINLMIVFVISGIWHGANWNFIIWGFLHGLYLILAIQKDKILKALRIPENLLTNTINMFVTFHLVVFAWIFFRATTFTDAAIIIKSIAQTKFGIQHLIHSLDVFSVGEKNLGRTLFLFTLIGGFMLADPTMDKIAKNKLLFKNRTIKYITYSLVMTGIILFGFFGDINFIYFQF